MAQKNIHRSGFPSTIAVWREACWNSASMLLSTDAVLLFMLHSGCMGRLMFGRIERLGSGGINVYSRPDGDAINEYISGDKLRSWCLIGADGEVLADWCSVRFEDRSRMLGPARKGP